MLIDHVHPLLQALLWPHVAPAPCLGWLQLALSPADTMAMAGLAFTCLERSNLNPSLRDRITLAIRTVKGNILRAQTPEGPFGNIYSTPLALQVGKRLWDLGPPWWPVGGGLLNCFLPAG